MKKKALFFGTPQIAVPSLETLAKQENIEIIGVGVFPDRPVGRKKILTKCPVKIAAQNLNLPILEIKNKTDLVDIYKNIKFDLAIVIAFGVIFPAEILEDGKFVNVHFSLLPKYRGASPVQSAILNGDTTSGITFQRMVYELDAGDVLFQKEYEIKNQTTAQLWELFAEKTSKNLPDFIKNYFSKNIKDLPQDAAQATFCGKFNKSDGEVFPEKETAQTIWQKYLAFTPWPGIFMQTSKGIVKLTQISNKEVPKSYKLECAKNSSIYISKAQISGKKEMDVNDILRGNGDVFKK